MVHCQDSNKYARRENTGVRERAGQTPFRAEILKTLTYSLGFEFSDFDLLSSAGSSLLVWKRGAN